MWSTQVMITRTFALFCLQGNVPDNLAPIYDIMSESFRKAGLSTHLVYESTKNWFAGMRTDSSKEGKNRPVPYAQWLPPPPQHSCRLLVIPISQSKEVTEMAQRVANKILALLPKDIQVFVPDAESYHCKWRHGWGRREWLWEAGRCCGLGHVA